MAHHQGEGFVDGLGLGRLLPAGAEEPHGFTQGEAVRPVALQPLPPPAGEVGGHPIQGGDHRPGRLRPAGCSPQGLGQGDRHRGHLRAEVGLRLAHVEAQAHHHVAQGGGLRLQLQLGEDAAQLAAVQDHVVGPLDVGADAAQRLHRVAHRHRRPRRQGGHLLQAARRPQQGGQVQPLPRRGQEGAAPAAPAPGLLPGDHHQPVGHGVHRPALDLVVGGVHRLQADQLLPHPAAGHRRRQLPGGEQIRRALQPVAPPGGGGDGVPLPPQGLDGLPDRRPAHPQGLAHGLPGQLLPRLQQGEHLVPQHGHPSLIGCLHCTCTGFICQPIQKSS